ncbi:MAG: formimidoylglutamate deiminase [Planctomycetota bacterium]
MQTKTLHFRSALVGNQWINEPVFSVFEDGTIWDISVAENDQQVDESFDVVALPGMTNVHSHAFQRAFAGLSEFRSSQHDSFWTWRNLMYKFLLQLNPEDVFIIARQLYLEMLMAGYTSVGEFHYIHNDVNGKPYANACELSEAIIRAADEAGIGLCLLPVAYQRGGFDDSPLSAGQRRFSLSNQQLVSLFEELNPRTTSNFQLGVALHSLRAISIESANELLTQVPTGLPVHIHIAEQTKEVDDCLAITGQRPVELLFNHFEVNPNWCLIHATHLNDEELKKIATSQATVGLCPTTEANLGDGIFRGSDFARLDGRFSIGSDSHCSVDLRDELRTLEYGQRLRDRSRAILCDDKISVGRRLYQETVCSGAKAIGFNAGEITVGKRADFTLVDPNHPAIAGFGEDRLLDRMIFCNADDPIIGSVVAGKVRMIDDNDFRNLVFDSRSRFLETCKKLTS